MVLSSVKLVIPAMLIVSFVPFSFSSEKVEIDCEKILKKANSCPSYCPKKFHPSSLNPTNVWAIPCICCSSGIQGTEESVGTAKSAGSTQQTEGFQPQMVIHEANPQDVPDESRKKLLNKLTKLTELKKLPTDEFSFWEARVQLTEDDLLSPDEEELLISLMVDCGVSWAAAFFLVHPLAGEQSQPVSKNFGLRSLFGSLLEVENPFSLDDLREQLEDVDILKVYGMDSERNGTTIEGNGNTSTGHGPGEGNNKTAEEDVNTKKTITEEDDKPGTTTAGSESTE